MKNEMKLNMSNKILCDYCNQDLTYSYGRFDHCLILKDRKYGPNSDAIIDCYICPIIDEDKYFCGKGCLKKWLEN